MWNRNIIFISIVLYVGLCFFIKAIPFFWDFATFSDIAQHFYANGYLDFNFDKSHGGGSSVLFSEYYALMWHAFGKTLFVSHLVLLPFVIGIIYEFLEIGAELKIKRSLLIVGLVLLFADPTISTQIILMSYDIPLLFLFLFSINSIYKNNRAALIFALVIISLFSIRGIMLIPVVFIFDILVNKRFLNRIYIYILPFVAILVQLNLLKADIYNHHDRQLVPLTQMLRNSLFIIWKIIDFGRIIVFILIIYLYRKQSIKEILLNKLIILICTLFGFYLLFMMPISNPIGHRYFMPITVFAILLLMKGIEYCGVVFKSSVILVSFIALLSGNFIESIPIL